MSDERLERLIGRLRAQGVDVGGLPTLQTELEALEEPPGLLQRVSRQTMDFARTQWGRLLGELDESAEAGALLRRRLRGEPLTEAQQAHLQAQLADLLRMVPASILSVAIEAIPVPGSSIVTPWLLRSLGLLPSRWREAHLLARLGEEAMRLRAAHQDAAAAQVEELAATLTAEADRRAEEQLHADLHLHWDADRSGHWDAEETAAFDAALARMRALVPADGWARCWYLCQAGRVFGPVRLQELRAVAQADALLVTHERVEGWVPVRLLWEGGG
jgi:hypothetical protein